MPVPPAFTASGLAWVRYTCGDGCGWKESSSFSGRRRGEDMMQRTPLESHGDSMHLTCQTANMLLGCPSLYQWPEGTSSVRQSRRTSGGFDLHRFIMLAFGAAVLAKQGACSTLQACCRTFFGDPDAHSSVAMVMPPHDLRLAIPVSYFTYVDKRVVKEGA